MTTEELCAKALHEFERWQLINTNDTGVLRGIGYALLALVQVLSTKNNTESSKDSV